MYYFKGTKIGYLVSGFAGILVLLAVTYPWINPLIFIVMLVLWIYINSVIFNRIANKKVLKVYKLLYDCEIEAYTKHCEQMLASCTGIPKAAKAVINTARLNLSTAYMTGGDNEAGLQQLLKITDFTTNRIGALQRCTYHNNFSSYYLRMLDTQNAAKALSQMEQAMQNPKLKDGDKLQDFNIYAEKQCLLKMAIGNYDGAEQIFDLAYQREQSAIAKVSAKHVLGRIYLHYGRTEEAKEAYEYVVEHGGSTFYKSDAIKRLETWGESFDEQREGSKISTPVSSPSFMHDNKPHPVSHDEGQLLETTAYHTYDTVSEAASRDGVLDMTMQQRKQYSLVIFALFAALFVMFGSIGISMHVSGDGPFSNIQPPLGGILAVLFWGLFAGWGFTGFVGGIWLGGRFVVRQGKVFIVFACVLFMLTIQIFWLVGLGLTIPFAIYNIWFIRRNKRL